MKKVFIVVTVLLGVTLVVMMLTKPEPKAHFDAVVGMAQNVVDQELTSDNVKKTIAKVGAEKLAELGIEGLDAETLERLGAEVDLTGVTEVGKDVAMNTAGLYLQSHMTVDDYFFVTMGMLNHRGTNMPMTLGIMGKVFVLMNEEQVRHLMR